MASPYNLTVEHRCEVCGVRAERPFCNMASEVLKALDRVKFTALYPKGSLLFVEGEESRGVYLLCGGRAKLTTSSTEGKTLIVKVAEVGELLGASAAMLGKPYEVSAETLEPAQVNFVKRDDFMKLMNEYPEACLHLTYLMSSKDQAAQREIRNLGLAQTTTEKLARLLLDWSDRGGEATTQGMRLKVLLTHVEIAEMIGTTRETVTRLLSDFRRRKIIDIKGSTYFLTNMSLLENLVTI